MSDDRFETKAVRAGLDPDPTYGSIIPAIHQTSTFVQPRVGELVAGYDYARAGNPTRTALENADARPPSISPSARSSADRVGFALRE